MYVGFGNAQIGVWVLLTPIESEILKDKKVIFMPILNLLQNCLSHKIEVVYDEFMICLNL
jgi:hypothetical protein